MTVQRKDSISPSYWLTSIKDVEGSGSLSVLKELIHDRRIFVFGQRTPGRTRVAEGDWLCFYASQKGVVGSARISSPMFESAEPIVRGGNKYTWTVNLDSVETFPETPVVIDDGIRKQLDAYKGKRNSGQWSWFVQATRQISKHDFELLSRRERV